jgi:hypothetical protein
MKRQKPIRFATTREREQHEEMERRKRRFAALETANVELCEPCKARDPWVDVCADCWTKIEKGIR